MSVAVLEPPVAVIPPPPPRTAKPVKTFRNATGLRIEEAILHIVDHRKGDRPVLSDAGLLLADGTLIEYLLAQINNVLADTETADARFVDQNHEVAQAARRILADPASFVEDSKFLAQALWNATGSKQSILPGSLIVSRFWAENHSEPFLALLKIDPTQVFLQTVSERGGHVIVGLRLIDDALPTADVRLQKASLIAPEGYARCDMLLLDRLVSAPAAAFFAKGFLNVKPVPTPRDLTKGFYDVYVAAKNELAKPEGPSLTPEEEDYLEEEVQRVLRHKSVDITAWTDVMDLPEPAKKVLIGKFKDELPTLKFEIDPSYAEEKLIKKRRIVGDFGIVIEYERPREKVILTKGTPYRRGDGAVVTPLTLDVPKMRIVK